MGCGCKNNQQTKPVQQQVEQTEEQKNENIQKAIQESMKKYYQQKPKG
jgi:hypothetical protein